MTMELRITELDMDGREPNYFQVTATGDQYVFDPPVFESEDLMECVKYCYDLGVTFEVLPLAAWYRETSYSVDENLCLHSVADSDICHECLSEDSKVSERSEPCDECGVAHDPNDIVTIYGVSND